MDFLGFIRRVLWGEGYTGEPPSCYPCACPVCGEEIVIAPASEPTPGDADFALCPVCRSVVCRTSEGEVEAFVSESRLRAIEEQMREVRFENQVLKDANAGIMRALKELGEEGTDG